MQLKRSYCTDIVVYEWVQYNQLENIEEVSNGDLVTVYSAIWNNGPLYHEQCYYIRKPEKEVALKCIHNSQNIINEILNEVWPYEIYFWFISKL